MSDDYEKESARLDRLAWKREREQYETDISASRASEAQLKAALEDAEEALMQVGVDIASAPGLRGRSWPECMDLCQSMCVTPARERLKTALSSPAGQSGLEAVRMAQKTLQAWREQTDETMQPWAETNVALAALAKEFGEAK